MKDRSARSIIFGFDFQIDAAIYIFIDNISDIHLFVIEGKCEDIEMISKSGIKTAIQVKSYYSDKTIPSYKKIKNAIMGFAETRKYQIDTNLVYCTNQYEKLIKYILKHEPTNVLILRWTDLPYEAQKVVDKYMLKYNLGGEHAIDLIIIPYFLSKDTNEKRAVIISKTEELLSILGLPVLTASTLVNLWHDYFQSSAETNEPIDKKHFLTFIILDIIYNTIDKYDPEQSRLVKYVDTYLSSSFFSFEMTNKLLRKLEKSNLDVASFIIDYFEYIKQVFPQANMNDDEYKMIMTRIIRSLLSRSILFDKVTKGGLL